VTIESANAALDQGRELLRRFLSGADDRHTMLTNITLLAIETVPGCDMASITMVVDGIAMTPVFSHDVALQLDETQYDFGDGPCLAAIRHQGVERFSTPSDQRWPLFRAAAEHGVSGVLSVPLVHEETASGALNLYSTTVITYDDDAASVAALFADQIGIAATRAALQAGAVELSQQLRQAMESRATIEQAKGALMAAEKITPDEAFDVLRRASQRENRKLRDIAADIVRQYTERASDSHT